MSLPKQVTIIGTVYSVSEENLDDGDTYYYGKIEYMTPRIRIEQTMVQDVKVQALIHEIFHALCHHTGHTSYDNEERLAVMLGCQLPNLLRQNPELVQAILKGDS